MVGMGVQKGYYASHRCVEEGALVFKADKANLRQFIVCMFTSCKHFLDMCVIVS